MNSPIPLASETDWIDVFRSGEWLWNVIGPFIELLGEPTVVMLLGTPLTLSLWMQTGSIQIPAIILILFIGLIVGGAPPAVSIIGYFVIVVAVLLSYRAIYDGGRR